MYLIREAAGDALKPIQKYTMLIQSYEIHAHVLFLDETENLGNCTPKYRVHDLAQLGNCMPKYTPKYNGLEPSTE